MHQTHGGAYGRSQCPIGTRRRSNRTREKGSSAFDSLYNTPAKIVYQLKRRTINSNIIKVFVLDEADNMVGEDGDRANSLLAKKVIPANVRVCFSR